jgi:hypothetical protein
MRITRVNNIAHPGPESTGAQQKRSLCCISQMYSLPPNGSVFIYSPNSNLVTSMPLLGTLRTKMRPAKILHVYLLDSDSSSLLGVISHRRIFIRRR